MSLWSAVSGSGSSPWADCSLPGVRQRPHDTDERRGGVAARSGATANTAPTTAGPAIPGSEVSSAAISSPAVSASAQSASAEPPSAIRAILYIRVFLGQWRAARLDFWYRQRACCASAGLDRSNGNQPIGRDEGCRDFAGSGRGGIQANGPAAAAPQSAQLRSPCTGAVLRCEDNESISAGVFVARRVGAENGR